MLKEKVKRIIPPDMASLSEPHPRSAQVWRACTKDRTVLPATQRNEPYCSAFARSSFTYARGMKG